jgi:plastocyanin
MTMPGRAARVRAVIATAAAAAVLAGGVACSNRDASINRRPQSGAAAASQIDGAQQVTIYVGDTYRFTPDVITVHPGLVRVVLVHQGTGAPHDLSVLGLPADFVPLVRPGGTTSATFMAPAPGKYTFVCTIHQAQGQTGTLIVTAS